MVEENLRQVRTDIAAAASAAGRNESDIMLLAVSKTKPLSMLQEAYQAGQRRFGENKVQELVQKCSQMPGDVEWHMIGHLQTNKVRQVVGRAALIHSVDSLHLAQEIERESERQGVITSILMEINIAGEDSKYGIMPEDAIRFAAELSGLSHIRVKGLMTVAPFTDYAEENRKYFRKMKQIAVDITAQNIDNITMDILSMGMSGDYKIAIEEGSTCVRVGTGIFGERNYSK